MMPNGLPVLPEWPARVPVMAGAPLDDPPLIREIVRARSIRRASARVAPFLIDVCTWRAAARRRARYTRLLSMRFAASPQARAIMRFYALF